MSIVSLRQELEEARPVTTVARASEEAGQQQLVRMMDEQLAQTQTIESLYRQVEASNNAARDSQALLGVNQEQQQQLRMLPPSNYPSGSGGVISCTPFLLPFPTPSTGIRTRELHGPGNYLLAHRRTQDMQSRCGPCMVRRLWTRRDRIHRLRARIPRQSDSPFSQNRLERYLLPVST
jgi:hypothetical protein